MIIDNGLQGGEYIEPYAGGAAAAFHLLFEDFVDHIHINDLDPGILAFWDSVLNDTARLVDLVRGSELTMAEWERQRSIQQEGGDPDLALGFATFYMNRTNRSGIITGGPIGGMAQDGKWALDARFNKPDLIHRIEKVARFRNRITLTGQDASEIIESWQGPRNGKFLLYADPPYYAQGSQLYLHHYTDGDHRHVAESIRRLSIPWIVSYDNVPQILSLYEDSGRIEYSLNYSAASRYKGSEVIFVSPMLSVPDVASPANLPLPRAAASDS